MSPPSEDPVERQIRDAIERGEFDNLTGKGRPLQTTDQGPGWWLRRQLERARQNDRVAEVARQVDQELGGVWALPDEARVRREVARLNELLLEVNRGVAPEDRADLFEVEDILKAWRRMGKARR
jgi:Domain of unknown function (DUF1992)